MALRVRKQFINSKGTLMTVYNEITKMHRTLVYLWLLKLRLFQMINY